MKGKWLAMLLVLFLSLTMIVGCGEASEEDGNEEENHDATGEVEEESEGDLEFPLEDQFSVMIAGEEKEVLLGDLMDLPDTTENIERYDDDGELIEQYQIKGVLMDELLASMDVDFESVDTLRVTAGDGYSVVIPAIVVENSPIIVAYEIDGKPLEEGTRPVRIFVPDEEAMYWVRNVAEISVVLGESEDSSDQATEEGGLGSIYFLETAVAALEKEPYDDTENMAVKTADLFEGMEIQGEVYLLAADDFDKYEERDTFLENHIVIEGENTPAFRGTDLPRGMHVRDLVWIDTGTTGMLSVERALELFEMKSVEEDEGIDLQELIDTYGLEVADRYLLEASDGFSAEVTLADLANGILYIRESGEVAVVFQGLPRNTAIRDLLFIEAIQ